MTNSFVYFEDAVVYRTKEYYKVILESEETTIMLKDRLVEAIAEKTIENENLIAILLAYIDYVRITVRGANQNPPKRLEDNVMIEGILLLVENISIEELIIKMKTMKWHEIVGLLESPDPIERIQRIL